jgi:hypothetical protein
MAKDKDKQRSGNLSTQTDIQHNGKNTQSSKPKKKA